MEAGDFYGVPGYTGSAFSSAGTLLATPDPVALKSPVVFPCGNGSGLGFRMPRSCQRFCNRHADLPHHKQLHLQRQQS